MALEDKLPLQEEKYSNTTRVHVKTTQNATVHAPSCSHIDHPNPPAPQRVMTDHLKKR